MGKNNGYERKHCNLVVAIKTMDHAHIEVAAFILPNDVQEETHNGSLLLD